MIDAGIDVSHAVHPDSVHHPPYDTSQCGELSYITISVNFVNLLVCKCASVDEMSHNSANG